MAMMRGLKERWASFSSRGAKRHARLGVIPFPTPKDADRRFRNPKLEILDAYYERRQYNHLVPWDHEEGADGSHVPVRCRRPRINASIAKNICTRVNSKLLGHSVFPTFKVEDEPDDTEFIKAIMKASKMRSRLIEPGKRILGAGSGFVRFWIAGGQFKMKFYFSKFCYPVFAESGELESLTVKYIYEDKKDLDFDGRPKQKWYKLELGQVSEILYDNPLYDPDKKEDPEFKEVARVDHGLGFVQGEWFRTAEIDDSPDGISLFEDGTDFIDEMCYSLSQSSRAVSYNQDPQLIISNMDEEELDGLIRSAMKAWNLGKGGEAKFLESNLNGVKVAQEFRDKVHLYMQQDARLVLLDPEKVVGSAQSGKAMEVLHGPMVDLVNEIRPLFEESIRNLILKMSVAVLIAGRQGIDIPITIPAGYVPQSLELLAKWPPIFPMTIEDLQKKVGVGASAAAGNVISRETVTRWLAEDFGVDDVEAEIERIKTQPIINPFGAF
jgi:hypothetical protein